MRNGFVQWAPSSARRNAPCALAVSQRFVSGGVARGDLNTMNPMKTTLNRRKGGVFRGLTHSSQSTDMQSGQLHVRKRILHATRHAAHSGSGRLRPDVVRWSFLMDSLWRGVETALPAPRHEQLLSSTEADWDAAAVDALEQAQKWFCTYELPRRLPLLEDSLADAELRELVRWPGLLRRAWIRLPPTSSGPTASAAQDVAPLPVRVACTAVDRVGASPLPSQLRRLNDAVYAVVEHELKQDTTTPSSTSASPREKAARARLLQTWEDDTVWHRQNGLTGEQ